MDTIISQAEEYLLPTIKSTCTVCRPPGSAHDEHHEGPAPLPAGEQQPPVPGPGGGGWGPDGRALRHVPGPDQGGLQQHHPLQPDQADPHHAG